MCINPVSVWNLLVRICFRLTDSVGSCGLATHYLISTMALSSRLFNWFELEVTPCGVLLFCLWDLFFKRCSLGTDLAPLNSLLILLVSWFPGLIPIKDKTQKNQQQAYNILTNWSRFSQITKNNRTVMLTWEVYSHLSSLCPYLHQQYNHKLHNFSYKIRDVFIWCSCNLIFAIICQWFLYGFYVRIKRPNFASQN